MKKRLFALVMLLGISVGAVGCGTAANKSTDADSAAKIDSTAKASSADSSGSASNTQEETTSGEVEGDYTSMEISKEDIPLEKCVELCEYKGLKLEKIVTSVNDEDIESQIYADLTAAAEEVTDGAVEDRDIVVIDFYCTVDGEKVKDEEGKDFETIIGENYFPEDVEKQMIGMKAGEKKDIKITFPDDYYNSGIAGKEGTYTVDLKTIKRQEQQISDDWVKNKSNSGYNTVDEYREYVRSKLQEECKKADETAVEQKAWEEITSKSKVTALLQKYVDPGKQNYKKMFEAYLKGSGQTMEDYYKSEGMTEEDFDKSATDYGKQMAAQAEILYRLAELENIKEDSKEVDEKIDEILKTSNYEDRKALYEDYGEEYIRQSALMQRVSEVVVSYAEVTEIPAEDVGNTTEGNAPDESASEDSTAQSDSTAGDSAVKDSTAGDSAAKDSAAGDSAAKDSAH